MAVSQYGTNNGLAVKAWAKKLFSEALKMTRFGQFRGPDGSTDSLVSVRTELTKQAGDRITIGLRMQLTGQGIQGDSTLEGEEEALTLYNDAVFIDQLRHAVRTAGKMSEQRVAFQTREEGMEGLRDWWADRLDCSMMNQLAGATTQQTQANAAQSTSIDNRFSGLQAALAPTAGTNIILCDQGASTPGGTVESSLCLTTTYALKLADIDRLVAKAKTTSPAIRPINVQGQRQYVIFLHPFQTFQLRANSSSGQWQDIQKSMLTGGVIGDNPIVTGLLGVYNNTLLVEDSRVPCVASSVTTSTSYRRSIFCGAQAIALGIGRDNSDTNMNWVEELFDFGNQLGVSAGMIFGMKKLVFNQDFATIVASGYAPAQ